LSVFMRKAVQTVEAMRRELRDGEGYSAEELDAMRQAFEAFDVDGSGHIDHAELVSLVMAAAPSLASDPKLRPQLVDIIRGVGGSRADGPGDGTLGFAEFLQLMRSMREVIHREQLALERQAMELSGFSPSEVHQFRGIFLASSNDRERLPREAFQDMMTPLCPDGRTACALTSIWRRQFICGPPQAFPAEEADGGPATPSGGGEEADFAQFLLLMRAVLDANLGIAAAGGNHGSSPSRPDPSSPRRGLPGSGASPRGDGARWGLRRTSRIPRLPLRTL